MKIESDKLIQDLEKLTKENIKFAEELKFLDENTLRYRKDNNSWNVLECLEHLNRYGDYYLPEIKMQLNKSNFPSERFFKSGWLGNYFANSMLPGAKMKPMKTFKDKNPLGTSLSVQVIDVFIGQQMKILDLLEQSHKHNLNKIHIKISIARWLRIKLGDTFRFVINHNLRHISQIKNILKNRQS
ncbi:DinB family protein [Flavobacterium sp. H122]|uniref:DinB family protein n=1 Tax=Flavobacterium sp. H122 TaxID=2529860 RepID=UPI0010AB3FF0|nr:DinB family protein [Flavobacterium sp. H122]